MCHAPVIQRGRKRVINGRHNVAIQGNILDHEYTIEANGQKVAEVSKKWFRLADTYGVEVAPGQNDLVILAATVAVDMMANPAH